MRLPWILPILVAVPLAAQTSHPLVHAAGTITAEDVMRHVGVMAADSMKGRDTPSPGLDLTAEYVAAEFRRAGLRPGGGAGGYIQPFGVTRWLIDSSRSGVDVAARGVRAMVRIGAGARYVLGDIPDEPVRGSVLLIAGPAATSRPEARAAKGRIVLLVADFSEPRSAGLNEQIGELAQAAPKAILVLSNRDSDTFAERVRAAALPRVTRDGKQAQGHGATVIEIHEESLGPVLTAAGIDPTSLRRLERGVVRLVPNLRVDVRLARKVLARAQVPNVVGILEGTDTLLRNEYLVYSAHIDHIGISSGQADSINNGADDNASGAAGLLELLHAFIQPGTRPKRSIVFFAPSGEEKGLLGSGYFTEHPTVPLENIVADINMDLIGRNWRDSVIAVGSDLSDLGETLRRAVRAHPELNMTPIADRWPEEQIFYRSDHYTFARKGVPILFFTSGTHADYHRPSDEVERIDGEKEARLLRLLFYLGASIADGASRPRWAPASYRQIVERP